MAVIIIFLSDEIRNEMKCFHQQWLIILNVKYTFFSDFKVLLLHSPTQVQTDGLFFFNSFSHFIVFNNTSSMILETEGLYSVERLSNYPNRACSHAGLSVVRQYCTKNISIMRKLEENQSLIPIELFTPLLRILMRGMRSYHEGKLSCGHQASQSAGLGFL